MTVTGSKWDDAKDAILADAAKVAEHSRSAGALPVDQVEKLLRAYYRHVTAEDLAGRDPDDVYGAAMSHYRLAAHRPQGTATVQRLHADRRRARLVGCGPHRGRGRHRRHAVPRRLGDDGARPARPRHPPRRAPAAAGRRDVTGDAALGRRRRPTTVSPVA